MTHSNEVPPDLVERIRSEMLAGYRQLITFAESVPFERLLGELYDRPPTERPSFVTDVILNEGELQKRNVYAPEGILVLRSAFGDRRPTLFCLKKYLPIELHRYWQNVNITFDNPTQGDERVEELAWRKPLPASVQAAVIAAGISPPK